MACSNAGEVRCAFQFVSNHWPPKVLTTVSSEARLSPHPVRPRRQIPATPLDGLLSLAARVAIWVQVGLAGMVTCAAANICLLYIMNDDSP